VKIKGDLTKAGIEVMLDIDNMEGDITKYMHNGVQQSDRVLLVSFLLLFLLLSFSPSNESDFAKICTPRFKHRVEEKATTHNNIQKEYYAALERQKQDPNFIIPLIIEGNHKTSLTKELPDILYSPNTC
jgi:hypothetical protein